MLKTIDINKPSAERKTTMNKMTKEYLKKEFNIKEEALSLHEEALKQITPLFKEYDEMVSIEQLMKTLGKSAIRELDKINATTIKRSGCGVALRYI